MPIELTPDWLGGLGVQGLDEFQVRYALRMVHDRLERDVGERISSEMTDEQVTEFGEILHGPADDRQATALAWLEANIPHHRDIVHEEFSLLEAMIAADPDGFADAVRASAREVTA